MKVLVVMNSSKVKFGGGIIQVILNYREQLIGSDILYEFAINIEDDDELIKELTRYGEIYHYLPDKKKSLLKYMVSLNKICRSTKYDAVHIHGNSATMLLELIIATTCGIKKRIVHCHNSTCSHPYLNNFLRPFFSNMYTTALACSDIAGEWIYGKNNFTVLHNAIDLVHFRFSEEIRNTIRQKMGIDNDTLIIGHVGNFNEQKNHAFLVKVFQKFQMKQKSVLFLIGVGSLEQKIKSLAALCNVQEKVFFLGMCTDVQNWMCAMDIFVIPSKWEGLCMAAIEAQACGLPVLASTKVPKYAKINNNMQFLGLDEPAETWANCIIQMSRKKHERFVSVTDFNEYDISKEKNKLLNIYACK